MPQSYEPNAYSVRAGTGVLNAALAAGATLFSMRNIGAKIAYVDRIVASFGCTVAFTAGSQLLFALERFSAATPTGGTQYTPMKHSTGSPNPSVSDCRGATTAGLTTTGATFDGNQVALFGFASPAAGFQQPPLYYDLNDDPIRLLSGEGLAIRNVNVWPAAGQGAIVAMASWAERG